jgi:prevent-host-death family protein
VYPSPAHERVTAPRIVFASVLIWYNKKAEGDLMQIVDDIKPVTYLKNKTADVLKYINETHRPMIITQNGEAKAVIQDPKSYEDMRNALAIMKLLSLSEEDIRKGNVYDEEDVFDSVQELLDQ